MTVKAWLKSRVADRVLSPLREELTGLIERGSTVLEIGSGSGDLLFRVAPIIEHGHGIDIDKGMIRFAESRRRKEGLSNLTFDCVNALKLNSGQYDIATSTLCLHELDRGLACSMMEMMISSSKKVLVADYTTAITVSGQLGIEVDEFFSGHYRQFRRYKNAGGIPAYAKLVGAEIQSELASRVDGISIWTIRGNAKAQGASASS